MDEEIKEALRQSAHHIEMLRDENRALAIKARAHDAMCNLIELLKPRQGEACGVDPVYILRRLLGKMEAAENAKKEPGNAQ